MELDNYGLCECVYVRFGVEDWGKKEKKCCNFYSEFQLDNQNQLAFVS